MHTLTFIIRSELHAITSPNRIALMFLATVLRRTAIPVRIWKGNTLIA